MHGIQHKNVKHEIGGDRRLLLGLCLFVLDERQLENEEEAHFIHIETLRDIFSKK